MFVIARVNLRVDEPVAGVVTVNADFTPAKQHYANMTMQYTAIFHG